jgi:dipeptidase E
VDAPEAAAAGYAEPTIWDGLGLIPYSIVPHHRSDHPESGAVEAMVEYFEAHKMPFVALRDGETIITVAS